MTTNPTLTVSHPNTTDEVFVNVVAFLVVDGNGESAFTAAPFVDRPSLARMLRTLADSIDTSAR